MQNDERRDRPEHQADERAEGDEPPDRLSLAADSSDVEAHASLEEHHRDRHADERLQPRPDRIGLNHAGDVRTEQNTRREQQDDARNAEVTRDHLRDHSRRERAGHGQRCVFGQSLGHAGPS